MAEDVSFYNISLCYAISDFPQRRGEHPGIRKDGLSVNKDIYTLTYPQDRLGRNAATHVITQYTTPEQWAACNPEAAEIQRQRARILFPNGSNHQSTGHTPASHFRSTPNRMRVQQEQSRRQRTTVWHCIYSDCPFSGPYAMDLYADCVLGCRRQRHPNSRTTVTGPVEACK